MSGAAGAAEHAVAVIAAGTARRRRDLQPTFESLLPAVDWSRLAAQLRSGRLLATLGPRVIDAAPAAAPPEFTGEVDAAITAARRNDALLSLIGERASARLEEAGIRNSLLKGPALGEAIHGEPGRRLASDIDLLVAPGSLHDAVAVVRELGYSEPRERLASPLLPELHFAMSHQRGELPPVELHWRIHWYESRFAADRLLPPAGTASAGWRPSRDDELAALLLFYARDGFTGLRQAVDLSAWWDRFGTELEQGALADLARSYPELRPTMITAVAVAESVVGLPAAAIVSAPARRRVRSRLAASLVDPRPYASEAQLYAEIALIDGLLAPPGGLRPYLRRQVLPAEGLRRQRTGAAAAVTVGSRGGYAVRVLARQGLALSRIAGVPGATSVRFVSR
jgi:hypothetical protein